MLKFFVYHITLTPKTFCHVITEVFFSLSGEVYGEADTPDILVCHEPQSIWISWYNQKLLMGKKQYI